MLELSNRDQVCGGARGRGDAADERAECRRDHQRAAKVALARPQSRVVQQADTERQQHRRNRDVGNPHGDQSANQENAEQHAVGPRADAQQHQIGQARTEP